MIVSYQPDDKDDRGDDVNGNDDDNATALVWRLGANPSTINQLQVSTHRATTKHHLPSTHLHEPTTKYE